MVVYRGFNDEKDQRDAKPTDFPSRGLKDNRLAEQKCRAAPRKSNRKRDSGQKRVHRGLPFGCFFMPLAELIEGERGEQDHVEDHVGAGTVDEAQRIVLHNGIFTQKEHCAAPEEYRQGYTQ